VNHRTQLHIDGQWRAGASGETIDVINPATGETLGFVAKAERADLEEVVAAASRGFATWRGISAFERSKLMRKAAGLLRERAGDIARLMTQEQGKPLAESTGETLGAADTTDWLAEEARRVYGRIVPPRGIGVTQLVAREPVGPVAAFTPWNFPINQAVRKIGSALAAGCSIVLKGPEETPASTAELVRAFVDAGIPAGVVNLVYGVPAQISEFLIGHPVIRKVSFTGSTAVGKHLAALAGAHMKRITLELGGHAPVIVMEDADIEAATRVMAGAKYRNAGQICIAPTRFLVHEKVHDAFVDNFTRKAADLRIGNGLDAGVTMGPLANARRVQAMEDLTADAIAKGAQLKAGGERIGNQGYFYRPTVLTNATSEMRAMNEEPFGPMALVSRFSTADEAIEEANRLSYGLAAYAFTRSAKSMEMLGAGIETGMLSINHQGLALPEIPFGGVKDSGYGSEGGTESLEGYLNTKLITQVGA